MKEAKRILIGETERAGWLISAPEVRKTAKYKPYGIRWVAKNTTYVLEFYDDGEWVEVPFVPNP